MSRSTILVVEDDHSLSEALSDTLELEGYAVCTAADGEAALSLLERRTVDLLVTDLQMRPMDGLSLLRRVKAHRVELPVLMMTAFGTIETAVEAMRAGAADYLIKPFEAEELVDTVQRFVAPEQSGGGEQMIAEDLQTRSLAELARRVAASPVTVMITGPSGTGKEVLARYIHRNSANAGGPFVAINCAAIPENMLEAVLFGYEKGAFTGAYRASPGKFEQAQGGTLLLDEISEMPLGLQAKLLRVLQEREVERVGGQRLIPLDVRVLATSNRNLREEVAAGRFREDLFYRLNVFPMRLPPLRERPRDIVPLAESFLRHLSQGGPVPLLDESAVIRLHGHSWPGNVRELENVMQRAMILRQGDSLNAGDLVFEEGEGVSALSELPLVAPVDAAPKLNDGLRNSEYRLIIEALRAGNGSRSKAAERLGISPRTLRYKLARMRDEGIDFDRCIGADSA